MSLVELRLTHFLSFVFWNFPTFFSLVIIRSSSVTTLQEASFLLVIVFFSAATAVYGCLFFLRPQQIFCDMFLIKIWFAGSNAQVLIFFLICFSYFFVLFLSLYFLCRFPLSVRVQ